MHMTNKKYLHEDISDSPEDREKLKPDQANFNLPEIKDIPGAGRSGKSASNLTGDTTISSADEEGDDLLGDDELDADNENDDENGGQRARIVRDGGTKLCGRHMRETR